MVHKFATRVSEMNLEDFPFYWIALVNSKYEMALEKPLKRLGLDNSKRRILILLGHNTQLSVSEIANHAILKIPTTTKILNRMKDDNLVDVNDHPTDGRSVQISLTDLGREKLAELELITYDILNNALSGLTPKKIERLNEMTKDIFHHL